LIIWGEQSIIDKCGWEFTSEDNDGELLGSRNIVASDGSKWRIGGIIGAF